MTQSSKIRGEFYHRHVGVGEEEMQKMLDILGYKTLNSLIDDVIPSSIRTSNLNLPVPLTEKEALEILEKKMKKNRVLRSFIGQGYYGTLTPSVIQRNLFENPGWYTAYTPYQPEISQGRLEALLNYQTMISDLTGLPISNASLLDEGTAASEAIHLVLASTRGENRIFLADSCFPQTLDVIKTRAEFFGTDIQVGDWKTYQPCNECNIAVVQYPNSRGQIEDYCELAEKIHQKQGFLIVIADLLSLTLLTPPGEFGADVCVGSTQRFGVPMGFGGPHAGFISCVDKLKRKLPGRLVGVSINADSKPAYRLSLQTREQHIRRDKATSNICTAQVLLAVIASMYAVYHGSKGLRKIASQIHSFAVALKKGLEKGGISCENTSFFDTLTIKVPGRARKIIQNAESQGYNFFMLDEDRISISFDETTKEEEIEEILKIFGTFPVETNGEIAYAGFERVSPYLEQPVFSRFHTETEMMRYLKRLENKDITLTHSMIPLGSCTMKLNAATEMTPLSWKEVAHIHPFVPQNQSEGYREMIQELEEWLSEITGFAKTSIQPNAGSQGEYAGLLAIHHYHQSRGDNQRDVCLIPVSAHGTNPASAVMAGFRVVPIRCDENGNENLEDIRAKAEKYKDTLAALMVTFPSTHGVYEENLPEICKIIHENGGLIYMDGANMNAQVGLTSPFKVGADVCHLNLHKTFCIPHGGGGPGVGPICVAEHLVPYLPGHRYLENGKTPLCSAPYGSASINIISWAYIAMMGAKGLTEATKTAILNANYLASQLSEYYPILYKGAKGLVAHECIIDLRKLSEESGVTVEDVAKRLMDYGFHAPTMSWPVGGTLMIEPTESESLEELNRFTESLISIYQEIQDIKEGKQDRENNLLKNAPHTAYAICGDEWERPYSRKQAAYPLPFLERRKFWPASARVDNVFGDRNLVCTCDSVENYATQ